MQYRADFFRRKNNVSLRVATDVVIDAQDDDEVMKRVEEMMRPLGATMAHVQQGGPRA